MAMAAARSDRSRAHSFSSDRPSVASSVTFQMPATVRPPPAYIAASVASQTVTDHHNGQLLDEDPDAEELQNAVFAEPALALLNAFLDHLLFAFLSAARSPSLTAIRPAIADVLKPRLAREACEAADEELQGLLAGEDEEFPAQDGAAADRWDVEKVWKRTRLRVMVYTRLGELEDEDEERYVQQERGLSMDEDEDDEAGLVSWASAIFLTSVIEYVAEQTLLAAGAAAFTRMAAKMRKQQQQPPALERLVVEEPDVEKIALNAALGRLWRTWRKRVRSPMSPGRGIRPISSSSSMHNRKMSHDTVDEPLRETSPVPEHVPTETDIAANIPLPLGANDVNEIEVPGLARTYEEVDDGSEGMQTPVPRAQRPSSFIMLAPLDTSSRGLTKQRPVSLPPPAASLFSVSALFSNRDASEDPEAKEADTADTFETPMEYAAQRASYIVPQEPAVPELLHVKQHEEAGDSPQEADADMMAFASSTGMGFRMSVVDPIKPDAALDREEEPELPSPGRYEPEPEHKIMHSKRMSVEKTGPPGIVRTYSTRSSSIRSTQHTPVATPKLGQHPEPGSYLDDARSDEEDDDFPLRDIGVARTSDVPIRSSPTPSFDAYAGKGKHAAHGGYVEVQPRQTAPSSISVRRTPTPDSIPIVPERSVARKDLHNREFSAEDYAGSANHYANVTSAPRMQEAPKPKSRGGSLPSLQEVENYPSNGKQRVVSGASHTPTTPQRSPTHPAREAASTVTNHQVPRKSAEEPKRTQRGGIDGSPSSEKSTVQRVKSTHSSGPKPASLSNGTHGREPSQVLRGRMSEEDRERQFDSLVKGEETVKFTLTPQTVRDFEDSPVQRKVEPIRPVTSNPPIHARPNADKDRSPLTSNLPNRSSSRSKGPVAAQHKSSPSRKVVTRPLAREPRIEAGSMRDFADFIRSTGPEPGQEKPVQPFVAISGNNSTTSLGRKVNNLDGASPRPRMNMEPRSPAGLSGGNDDLIDFIRQGPPSANTGQPRIPRNVAPFRTTVDSDQFDTMLDGHNNIESAYGSTASTLDSKHSNQTINSRTGLIPEPKVVQPAYSNTPQKLSGNMASNSEPHITKTRRRVKDPYAIDFSDDDDEDEDQLTALPPSSQPQQQQAPRPQQQAPRPQAPRQESLMDFLNGMDPPNNNKPQPFMLSEETIAAAKARASASGSTSTLSSTQTATRNGAVPFGAISSTSVGSDAHRAYKPRVQPRTPVVSETRGSKSATSDLAEFLRNSGPPEPPVSFQVKKEQEKKTRKFWNLNRKKTYGDLP